LSLSSVMAVGRDPLRDHEVDDPLVEGLVVRVDELDQDLVRPRRQAVDDEGLAARVSPAPGRVVHGYMNVTDTRRHIESCRTEHLHDPQVFGPVLYNDPPKGEGVRHRGSIMIFAGGSLASGTTPAGPRISLAVCARATDTHKANAIATKGISIVFIANAPGLLSFGADE
jgi:hypothetical protein